MNHVKIVATPRGNRYVAIKGKRWSSRHIRYGRRYEMKREIDEDLPEFGTLPILQCFNIGSDPVVRAVARGGRVVLVRSSGARFEVIR